MVKSQHIPLFDHLHVIAIPALYQLYTKSMVIPGYIHCTSKVTSGYIRCSTQYNPCFSVISV